jgi:hypothetical protein
MERGYITGRQLQADDHARMLVAMLESPGRVESISVVPR